MKKRFHGPVGFVSTVIDDYGVATEVITEKSYYGDVLILGYRLDDNQVVNRDIQLSNRVSLLADQYAFENASYIAYVTIAGTKWAVSSITYEDKRIVCSFKGIYRGGSSE